MRAFSTVHAGSALLFAYLHTVQAVRWVTAWEDIAIGEDALLSWADMGDSIAIIEFKVISDNGTKTLIKKERGPGLGHPFRVSSPTLEDLEDAGYDYYATRERYWWEVTSKDTKDNDYSSSFFLGGDDIYHVADEKFDPAGWIPTDELDPKSRSTSIITKPTSSATTASGDSQESGKPVESDSGDKKAKETSQGSDLASTGPTISENGQQTTGQGPQQTSDRKSDPTSEAEYNGDSLDGEGNGMSPAVYAGIGAGAGIGGILIVAVVVWMFIRRRRREARQPEGVPGSMAEHKDMPPKPDDADTKQKAELVGSEVFEKGEGGEFIAELPVGAHEQSHIHGDGRYGGRSEMAA